MRITIGDKSKECMNILGLKDYPFTSKELSTAFRMAIKEAHPDKETGDHEKAVKVVDAYKHLKNLAYDDNSKTEFASIEEEITDIFKLWETCPECKGLKVKRVIHHKEPCMGCGDLLTYLSYGGGGKGYKTFICRKCGGSGKFQRQLINGEWKDKGICFTCKGTGRVKITCKYCNGTGWIGEDRVETSLCYTCSGSGKVEINPFNPVIPKGAVLGRK